ncbi:glycosyltransferase [Catenulispora pinisilvae]|uniref:glycosyltransferase n=1 Tax=Catenulispora pinisilvae TaxID=2705253 RepID=UPI0018924A3B|nr:glycosyltransferase [Catenulispora pinisilvae]
MGVVWHVNSTARGGGVAEIIGALCQADDPRYRTRRFVTSEDPALFEVTKRIHHRLHGVPAGELPDSAEHDAWCRYARANVKEFLTSADPKDLVVLHDPQTLPMAPLLAEAGVRLAWRCHIGTAGQNAVTAATWDYLRQFWSEGLVLVFSSPALVPALDHDHDLALALEKHDHPVRIIRPSIDPGTLKNRPLSDDEVSKTLTDAGLGTRPISPALDSSVVTVSESDLGTDPVIVQVSRWDPLKDMAGVLEMFASSDLPSRAHLVLCGPSPQSISDDPEAAGVYAEVVRRRDRLVSAVRRRVHLVCPALDDTRTNALLVNALQRRATVVVQKSLEEGFGLTVTEAMWKARPVVAARVGGIPSQIEHGVTGLLLDDPRDLDGFAAAVGEVVAHSAQYAQMGRNAHEFVDREMTSHREIREHTDLYRLLEGS